MALKPARSRRRNWCSDFVENIRSGSEARLTAVTSQFAQNSLPPWLSVAPRCMTPSRAWRAYLPLACAAFRKMPLLFRLLIAFVDTSARPC
uniref:Uncharacterized protein n=1 Tax=Knipowitschia caucasica TaxID=637954 RepID=A0AAV2KMV7_KNICA